ncbi:hypothetical protein BASA81_006115 [Batrachochytrium salamandrivorans]|nr:hypothetical protein BASA81_006115 [Batrachochytrium salamandrivorans]
MIPTASGKTQAKHPRGDGPATQASRLAATLDSVVFADGCQLVSHAKQPSAMTREALLWTSQVEIQSVTSAIASHQVAAVNGLGQVWINNQDLVLPKCKEFGWCGLAFDGASNRVLNVTRMWEKDTLVVDLETGLPVTRLEHSKSPLAITASPSKPNVLFVCEWDSATVWDTRARIPLVETLAGNQLGGGGNGPLWAVDAAESSFCVGGEDRVVASMDDRKWRSFDLWKTPLKHDIVALALASSKRLVALGLDHEIAQCMEKHSHRLYDNHRVFRARARWTGVCAAGDGELYCRDAHGTLYSFNH